jgi:hypothetical protein
MLSVEEEGMIPGSLKRRMKSSGSGGMIAFKAVTPPSMISAVCSSVKSKTTSVKVRPITEIISNVRLVYQVKKNGIKTGYADNGNTERYKNRASRSL